jgi:hypothetical protein
MRTWAAAWKGALVIVVARSVTLAASPSRGDPAPASQPASQPAPGEEPSDPPVARRACPASQPAGASAATAPDPWCLPPAGALPPPSAPPGARRPLPVYSGRPAPGPGAIEVLAWVPRLILLPLNLVLDYGLRRPLVGLAEVTEQHHVPDWIKWLLTWRGGRSGIYPTFKYEVGLQPTMGFYLFNQDIIRPGDKLILAGSFWSRETIQAKAEGRMPVFDDRKGTARLRVRFLDRPDQRFYGVGPNSTEADKTYFRERQVDVDGGLDVKLGGLNRISLKGDFRHTTFGRGQSPSIGTRFDVTDPSVVPGFDGYNLLGPELQLDLDTRSTYPWATASGGRLELTGRYAVDPGDTRLQFLRWGGRAGGFLDLGGQHRTLQLSIYTEFVEPLGSRAVPFTELVALGGLDVMRGFVYGRMRGESGLVAALEYRYPIWAWLDADIFVEAGNAFGRHLQGFAMDKLAMSWGLALRSSKSRDYSFDVLLGFGSTPFDAPRFKVLDYVHFGVGITTGF